MPREQVQGSNHVSDGHVATVHDQENVLKLKRISEIAEEQLTHAASLAGMPAQNLLEARKAPILRDAKANDHQQAPVEHKLKQLDYQPVESQGLPSRTHRTNLTK